MMILEYTLSSHFVVGLPPISPAQSKFPLRPWDVRGLGIVLKPRFTSRDLSIYTLPYSSNMANIFIPLVFRA